MTDIPHDPAARLENLSRRAWQMVDGIFRTGRVHLENGQQLELKPEAVMQSVLAVAKLEPGKQPRLPGTLRKRVLKETA